MSMCQVFVLLVVGYAANAEAATCRIDINEPIDDSLPLILVKDGSGYEFARPTSVDGDSSYVVLNEGSDVVFACPGTSFVDSSVSNESAVSVTCDGDDQYSRQSEKSTFTDYLCKASLKSSLEMTGQSCSNGDGEIVSVGFDIQLSTPFRQTMIKTCFNKDDSVTYYSEHTLLGDGMAGAQSDNNRPSFRVGISSLYPFSPDTSYTQKEQKVTLTNLLGSESAADDVLAKTYFARGHLAPDADFIYVSTQSATYYFINAAPQWQSFNGGSWRTLEDAVRNMAKSGKQHYTVVTGTHRVRPLLDVNNNPTDIYLYGFGSEEGDAMLPAPEFFWKIVYEPNSKKGVGFVGVNTHETLNDVNWPCEDICSSSNWGSPSWEGSIICCSIQDLQDSINYYPHLDVSGVLNGV